MSRISGAFGKLAAVDVARLLLGPVTERRESILNEEGGKRSIRPKYRGGKWVSAGGSPIGILRSGMLDNSTTRKALDKMQSFLRRDTQAPQTPLLLGGGLDWVERTGRRGGRRRKVPGRKESTGEKDRYLDSSAYQSF